MQKINFNNESSIIELTDNVTIIRNGEKITGDFEYLIPKIIHIKLSLKTKLKLKL